MTPSCRAEIHDPTRAGGPARGQLRLVLSRRVPAIGPAPWRFQDDGFDDMALDEVPPLVVELLHRGRADAARLFLDAWFVSHAQAAGHSNIVLGGGP